MSGVRAAASAAQRCTVRRGSTAHPTRVSATLRLLRQGMDAEAVAWGSSEYGRRRVVVGGDTEHVCRTIFNGVKEI